MIYKCNNCLQEFSRNSGLVRHVNNNNCKKVELNPDGTIKNKKDSQCGDCLKIFTTVDYLNIHVKGCKKRLQNAKKNKIIQNQIIVKQNDTSSNDLIIKKIDNIESNLKNEIKTLKNIIIESTREPKTINIQNNIQNNYYDLAFYLLNPPTEFKPLPIDDAFMNVESIFSLMPNLMISGGDRNAIGNDICNIIIDRYIDNKDSKEDAYNKILNRNIWSDMVNYNIHYFDNSKWNLDKNDAIFLDTIIKPTINKINCTLDELKVICCSIINYDIEKMEKYKDDNIILQPNNIPISEMCEELSKKFNHYKKICTSRNQAVEDKNVIKFMYNQENFKVFYKREEYKQKLDIINACIPLFNSIISITNADDYSIELLKKIKDFAKYNPTENNMKLLEFFKMNSEQMKIDMIKDKRMIMV